MTAEMEMDLFHKRFKVARSGFKDRLSSRVLTSSSAYYETYLLIQPTSKPSIPFSSDRRFTSLPISFWSFLLYVLTHQLRCFFCKLRPSFPARCLAFGIALSHSVNITNFAVSGCSFSFLLWTLLLGDLRQFFCLSGIVDKRRQSQRLEIKRFGWPLIIVAPFSLERED